MQTGFVWPAQSAKDLIDDYVSGLIDGHLLLHGPFGTGKTTISKMTLDRDHNFIEMPFVAHP